MTTEELKNLVEQYFNLIKGNLPHGSQYFGCFKDDDNNITITYLGTKSSKRFIVTLDEILRQIRESKLRKLLD